MVNILTYYNLIIYNIMKKIIRKADEISDIMKNFSNRDKLAILCFLGKEIKNVTEIMECSDISQSQISQYLGKMKLEGILESYKE
ncbi:winged helix-turn-helix transcriptional regulator [bacterium]|jgi:DNA-binding transcriptional ArsR family regulator|nr:winged helix-turn-helix transcriptional regulator [bacterium]